MKDCCMMIMMFVVLILEVNEWVVVSVLFFLVWVMGCFLEMKMLCICCEGLLRDVKFWGRIWCLKGCLCLCFVRGWILFFCVWLFMLRGVFGCWVLLIGYFWGCFFLWVGVFCKWFLRWFCFFWFRWFVRVGIFLVKKLFRLMLLLLG